MTINKLKDLKVNKALLHVDFSETYSLKFGTEVKSFHFGGTTVETNPFIDTLNFLSDSPTTQYRKKYVFHMITELEKDFPQIKRINWNYTKAGHGKGAPDGVGAVLKRTADKLVTFGHDIGTFEQFVNVVERFVENIHIMKVEEKEIIQRDNSMPKN